MKNADIFEQVKETLLNGIKAKGLEWFKPWKNANGLIETPINRTSGKPYHGMNVFFLNAHMDFYGYESNEWLTYKQAQGLGGQVRKGEKSVQVYFWKVGVVSTQSNKYYNSESDALKAGEPKDKLKKTFTLRTYRVFNITQCDDIEPRNKPEPKPSNTNTFKPIEKAEEIVVGWENCPTIRHKGNRAFYMPSMDFVQMPKPEQFVDADSYYKTLFHELVHSTGHESRLSRKGVTSCDGFGSEVYSMEELVAESGSMVLSEICGLQPKHADNSVAYIKGWTKRIKETPAKAIVSALTQSSKAVEYILA